MTLENSVSNAAPIIDTTLAGFGVPIPAASIASSVLGYYGRNKGGKLQVSLNKFFSEFKESEATMIGQVWSNLGAEFGEDFRDEVHLNTLEQIETSEIAKLISRSVLACAINRISVLEHFELMNVFRRLLLMDLRKIEEEYERTHISQFSQSSQGRILSVGLGTESGFGISTWSWNDALLLPLLKVLHQDRTEFKICIHPAKVDGFMTFPKAP